MVDRVLPSWVENNSAIEQMTDYLLSHWSKGSLVRNSDKPRITALIETYLRGRTNQSPTDIVNIIMAYNGAPNIQPSVEQSVVRALIEEAAVIQQSMGIVGGTLTMATEQAAAWSLQNALDLANYLTDMQRQTITSMLVKTMNGVAPMNGLDLAPLILSSVDLTPTQAGWVLNRYNRLISRGLSPFDAQANVDDFARRLRLNRARTIARTEINRGLTASRLLAWKQAGQAGLMNGMLKNWLIAPNCCDKCATINRDRIPLDQPFSTPWGFIDSPMESHPNCRCSVVVSSAFLDIPALNAMKNATDIPDGTVNPWVSFTPGPDPIFEDGVLVGWEETVTKGEAAGHPFRGNQWTKGILGSAVGLRKYVPAKYEGVEGAVALIMSGSIGDGSLASMSLDLDRSRPDLPRNTRAVYEPESTTLLRTKNGKTWEEVARRKWDTNQQLVAANIATAQGFDGLPEIVSRERLRDEAGGIALWSGGGSISTRTEYENGALFVTPGVEGFGRYFTVDPIEASGYVGDHEWSDEQPPFAPDPVGKRIMSGRLRSDAKVIGPRQLQVLTDQIEDKVVNSSRFQQMVYSARPVTNTDASRYDRGYSVDSEGMKQRAQDWWDDRIAGDHGIIAAALGYDAIVVQKNGTTHVIVLNRTAVLISPHETWKDFKPAWYEYPDRQTQWEQNQKDIEEAKANLLAKGEGPGHPFRGNQWEEGVSGPGVPVLASIWGDPDYAAITNPPVDPDQSNPVDQEAAAVKLARRLYQFSADDGSWETVITYTTFDERDLKVLLRGHIMKEGDLIGTFTRTLDLGNQIAHHETLFMLPHEQKKGIGGEFAFKSLFTARDAGFKEVQTVAVCDPKSRTNGTVVWPRIGYKLEGRVRMPILQPKTTPEGRAFLNAIGRKHVKEITTQDLIDHSEAFAAQKVSADMSYRLSRLPAVYEPRKSKTFSKAMSIGVQNIWVELDKWIEPTTEEEMAKGEGPGHPFRGNQWTKGISGGIGRAVSRITGRRSAGIVGQQVAPKKDPSSLDSGVDTIFPPSDAEAGLTGAYRNGFGMAYNAEGQHLTTVEANAVRRKALRAWKKQRLVHLAAEGQARREGWEAGETSIWSGEERTVPSSRIAVLPDVVDFTDPNMPTDKHLSGMVSNKVTPLLHIVQSAMDDIHHIEDLRDVTTWSGHPEAPAYRSIPTYLTFTLPRGGEDGSHSMSGERLPIQEEVQGVEFKRMVSSNLVVGTGPFSNRLKRVWAAAHGYTGDASDSTGSKVIAAAQDTLGQDTLGSAKQIDTYLHEIGHRISMTFNPDKWIPGGKNSSGQETAYRLGEGIHDTMVSPEAAALSGASDEISHFLKKASKTPWYKERLSELKKANPGYAKYWNSPQEVWARAYAQWAVMQLIKSKDFTVQSLVADVHLADLMGSTTPEKVSSYDWNGDPIYHSMIWPKDEFAATVGPAVEAVLRARGLMK